MEKLAGLTHLFVTVLLGSFSAFIVVPAITDVTMSALCPGKDECSLAIYLSGFQQAIIGLGTVVMTPVIGNLSDEYGRKALLTIPMALSIIPLAILAYSRTTTSFYAYFVIRTLTAMVGEGSINCLALAYVADNISEGQRASAFGVLSGVASAAFVCGTLAARFLSTASTFQVATLVSMIATIYMRVFLKETFPKGDSSQALLKKEPGMSPDDGNSSEKIQTFKKIPSIGDLISLLKCRAAFSQAAVVVFFNGLAEGGLQASLLYFLKARFHFNKDQFADIMLIVGVMGTISQLLFMPLLAPRVSEEKLLSIGLFMGCTNIFLNSIAWSFWVPYAIAALAAFAVFANPCVRSIASKQVGPNDQGKAQGCISGISSSAQIISPLIFSPLTALFLSQGAPFYFPGFSIMCIGFASMIAFIQSTMIRAVPPISSQPTSNSNCIEA
ncbi:hippocampus abundant transcript-like protein 1 [Vitis riparia]|uniref:hippocampus abundant transcript-like protein 1 n=1 Tax=Vitis riparia TaxID=96939 RepID=UPI00155A0684|nr:hippocampus abundant transcript-like protein 1 [Vitis riparia]